MLLLINLNVFGQSHQEQVIKYVDKHLGKKVGDGLCYELVQGAIRTYDRKFDGTVSGNDKYGILIDSVDIAPGDILRMTGGTRHRIKHVCIVYKVVSNGFFVAEQNTNNKLSESVVKIHFYSADWIEEYYGKIKCDYYRLP